MKTIAIPVFGNRISSRFDHARNLLVVTLEDGAVKASETLSLQDLDAMQRVTVLSRRGVDVLICGGVPEWCLHRLLQARIRVIPWVNGDTDDVLSRFLAGDYETNPSS